MKNYRRILMQAVASLKICTLKCYFCWNYIMFEPKRFRGIICHNTEELYKTWGETDMCFEKLHECGKFLAQHPKISKFAL